MSGEKVVVMNTFIFILIRAQENQFELKEVQITSEEINFWKDRTVDNISAKNAALYPYYSEYTSYSYVAPIPNTPYYYCGEAGEYHFENFLFTQIYKEITSDDSIFYDDIVIYKKSSSGEIVNISEADVKFFKDIIKKR